MKPSYYNVLTKLDDNDWLLYNTYWESLAVLSNDEREQYKLIEEDDAQSASLELRQQLEAQHFILEDPEDEANWLQYEYEKYKFDNRVLELVICPTLDCNYRCDYCYERRREGLMTQEVQDAIMRFVEGTYERALFQNMRVTWYGGEPLLGADVIEALGKRFLAFCDKHGLGYHSSIMTNGSLADAETMDRMYDAGVKSVMVTFGGKGAEHDRQRPCCNGCSTYDDLYNNTVRMLDEGVVVNFQCVYDDKNIDDLVELAGELSHDSEGNSRPNFFLHSPYPKTDYRDEWHDEDGNSLYEGLKDTLGERVKADLLLHKACDLDANRLHGFLKPIHHFCGAHSELSWVIDELGGVNKCLGTVGYNEQSQMFNLCDEDVFGNTRLDRVAYFMRWNPAKDDMACRTCRVFPICNGSCYMQHVDDNEWITSPCNTIKVAINDYLCDYYKALVAEGRL